MHPALANNRDPVTDFKERFSLRLNAFIYNRKELHPNSPLDGLRYRGINLIGRIQIFFVDSEARNYSFSVGGQLSSSIDKSVLRSWMVRSLEEHGLLKQPSRRGGIDFQCFKGITSLDQNVWDRWVTKKWPTWEKYAARGLALLNARDIFPLLDSDDLVSIAVHKAWNEIQRGNTQVNPTTIVSRNIMHSISHFGRRLTVDGVFLGAESDQSKVNESSIECWSDYLKTPRITETITDTQLIGVCHALRPKLVGRQKELMDALLDNHVQQASDIENGINSAYQVPNNVVLSAMIAQKDSAAPVSKQFVAQLLRCGVGQRSIAKKMFDFMPQLASYADEELAETAVKISLLLRDWKGN